MILIEAEGGGDKRYRVGFHPLMTVVVGLSPELRQSFAASFSDALGGKLTRLNAVVDVGGERTLLTPELIESVGLTGESIDNVVETSDFPGAIVAGVSLRETGDDAEGQSDSSPLDLILQERDDAKNQVMRITAKLEEARSAGTPVSRQELEMAVAAHARALARVEELRDELEAANEGVAEGMDIDSLLNRAISRRDSLQKRGKEIQVLLKGPVIDVGHVEDLLVAARDVSASEAAGGARMQPGELADAWVRIVERIKKEKARPRPPDWLINETAEQLDECQARVHALSVQLEEGIDVEAQLERALTRLDDAQAAWDEINSAEEKVRSLEMDRSTVHSRAEEILGIDLDATNIEQLLRNRQVELEAQGDPRKDLVSLLAMASVPSTVDTVISVAMKWLEQQNEVAVKTEQFRREVANIAVTVHELTQEIAKLESGRLDSEEPGLNVMAELRRELIDAEAFESDAAARLNRLKQRSEKFMTADTSSITGLENELSEAEEIYEAARRKVEHFERLEVLHGGTLTRESEKAKPWWETSPPLTSARSVPIGAEVRVDISRIDGAEVQFFLLARAAELRRIARGGSVPLVIDAALDEFPPPEVDRILDSLLPITPAVQIIYLASNDLAERWCRKHQEDHAAIVRAERL